MKLSNPIYQSHLNQFKEYLATLGYSRSAQINYPMAVAEYLFYLESERISDFSFSTEQTTKNHFECLSARKNRKKSGALSNVYLNSHLNGLKRFQKYLHSLHNEYLPLTVERLLNETPLPLVLTRAEIEQLYQGASQNKKRSFSLRDRTLLHLCYGCGLRKSECSQLDVEDVQEKEKLLHIRKGKGNQERYIPLTESILTELQEYIKEARPDFERSHSPKALLLGNRGGRLISFYNRLQLLTKQAGLEKNVHPHTLRHSIATHLMQSGMEVEQIAKFLGHRSLASTQLYMHIVHESV